MTDTDERIARFDALRTELATMDDHELKQRFWELCEQVMTPVVHLARTHTTPSIERSVLLRMGIDSTTTQAVVGNLNQAGLLGKGAGHAVLRLAEREKTDLASAAQRIATDPEVISTIFEAGDND